MRVNGHMLPSPSEKWAPFFEEFVFYTSRYFPDRLNQLEKIAGRHSTQLYDFHARELNDVQRFVLSWMMKTPLEKNSAVCLLKVLERFHELDTQHH